ncbi:GNAT family N-acetyltransferase [Desulfovibrio ferrophilus]|uniref:Lea3 protein n=1 Tax=Desulfovibrio ferrophilus TaxID=241368 RepID=A0A2Z6B1L2_9BACT|nr:GNAT family N-acetyltransferase [Desulfovibrio ferrophilus]BBD09330.1 Lea3 protein [Desulfovibrio ferrophilus]
MSEAGVLVPTQHKQWMKALQDCRAGLCGHIYYYPDYVALYAKAKTSGHAFVYREGTDVFFMPYLLQPIPAGYHDSPAYCLETAYGYGGLLASVDEPAFHMRAWEALRKVAKAQGIVAGFIRYDPAFDNASYPVPTFVSKVFERQVVLLQVPNNETELIQGYRSSTRNKVRKAMRSRLVVQQVDTELGRQVLQQLYSASMAHLKADSFYRFDGEYFQSLFTSLKKHHRIFLARHDDNIVGAMLTINSEGFSSIHLSATNAEGKKLGAANLLRHEFFVSCLKNGVKTVNCGGGLTNSTKDPLLKFKAGFSRATGEFHTGRIIFDPASYQSISQEWFVQNPSLALSHGQRHLHFLYQ